MAIDTIDEQPVGAAIESFAIVDAGDPDDIAPAGRDAESRCRMLRQHERICPCAGQRWDEAWRQPGDLETQRIRSRPWRGLKEDVVFLALLRVEKEFIHVADAIDRFAVDRVPERNDLWLPLRRPIDARNLESVRSDITRRGDEIAVWRDAQMDGAGPWRYDPPGCVRLGIWIVASSDYPTGADRITG